MKRLVDYQPKRLSGIMTKFGELVNEEVIIEDAIVFEGQYGPTVEIQLTDAEGTRRRTISTAKYIVASLVKAVREDALPVAAKFIKDDRSYVIE